MPSHTLWREDMIEGSDREQGRLPDGLDSYWRLDSYKKVSSQTLVNALREAGHSIPLVHRLSKASLRARYRRVAKRLLCYEAYSVAELRVFVQARGLQVETTYRDKERARLIRALKKGDTEPSFHKLMDLPAELRLNIYEFYICDFPDLLHKPTQPPLARTSPEVRKEFLPLWHANQWFKFVLKMKLDSAGAYDLRWDSETDHFIKSVHHSSLAMMRRITIIITADLEVVDDVYTNDLFVFEIKLGGPKHSCSVELSQIVDGEFMYESCPELEGAYEFRSHPRTFEDEVQATFEVARSRTKDKTPELKLEDLGVARRKMEVWLDENFQNNV